MELVCCAGNCDLSECVELTDRESFVCKAICFSESSVSFSELKRATHVHQEILSLCQEVRNSPRGSSPLSDKVKGWLAKEHGGAARSIERVISGSRIASEEILRLWMAAMMVLESMERA